MHRRAQVVALLRRLARRFEGRVLDGAHLVGVRRRQLLDLVAHGQPHRRLLERQTPLRPQLGLGHAPPHHLHLRLCLLALRRRGLRGARPTTRRAVCLGLRRLGRLPRLVGARLGLGHARLRPRHLRPQSRHLDALFLRLGELLAHRRALARQLRHELHEPVPLRLSRTSLRIVVGIRSLQVLEVENVRARYRELVAKTLLHGGRLLLLFLQRFTEPRPTSLGTCERSR